MWGDSASELTGVKTVRPTTKPMMTLTKGMITRFNGPPRSPDHTISPTYRAIGTIVRLAEVRAATSNLLTMLSNGTLTPPAIVRYSLKDFQEAVRRADGEAGQQKVLLDFSERSVESP